jgi:cytochrome c-type biogenesis protein CcmH
VIAVLLALSVGLATAAAPAAAAAAHRRASLIQIENDLMCVACHESLAVAQSPEAFSERQYINTLIAQGETRKQIENNMVAQYGASVLALPPAQGFNVLVYVVPPAVVLIGIVTVLFTLPKWRARSRSAAAESDRPAVALDPGDASRLDDDLKGFA